MNSLENQIMEHLKKYNWDLFYEHIDLVKEEDYAKIRMGIIGASDSSKLLGVNPFTLTPEQDLLEEKLTGDFDESIGKKASVRMGKDIEPIILSKTEAIIKRKVYKPYNMYKDNDSMLGVNFDGVTNIDNEFVPVEAKAVTKYGKKYYNFEKALYRQKNGELLEGLLNPELPNINVEEYEDITDYIQDMADEYGIPVYYYTQLQQQMIPLGAKYGYLTVLDVDNWDINIFYIKRDEYTIREIVQKGSVLSCKIDIIKNKKRP